MCSTSDPDICRTSDGLPCVMWDPITDLMFTFYLNEM
ncbi:Uncharacterized protein APZ42_009078 [Daphnia magna]|uniref:Uncharacterized protein n=1 Tax=Daphnia magna TaxID=35525 RepID=A0A164E863_9CRUS|nr:Uncharacterized protein APZ42_009078 [Daphnia magna]